MSFTSEIADFASRLRVAQLSNDLSVSLRHTALTRQLSELFYSQGYIQSFFVSDSQAIVFRLKYTHRKPFLKTIRLVSTPGRRVFWNLNRLSCAVNRHSLSSIYILSTPAGLRTSTECLTGVQSGGEVLLEVTFN